MNKILLIISIVLSLIFSGCGSSIPLDKTIFEKGKPLGKVDKRLKEASGIVASRINPGKLWVVNDGGHSAELFLINEQGQIEMTCPLKDARNTDWEDLAIHVDSVGTSWIVIGDIGDNLSIHPTKTIYRIKEPKFNGPNKEITEYDVFQVKLSDGMHDAEAILAEPGTRNFIMITKGNGAGFYEFRLNTSGTPIIAKRKSAIIFSNIVSGTISRTGGEVILKDYENLYYWKQIAGQSVYETISRKPVRIPYRMEPQGEAVCFSSDDGGIYTLAESHFLHRARLIFYKRKAAAHESKNATN